MERGLLVIALVLSLVVGGVGLMPPRKPVAFPWQSALPALLAFVLSLPSSGIFAPGQALGLGVLLGGAAPGPPCAAFATACATLRRKMV